MVQVLLSMIILLLFLVKTLKVKFSNNTAHHNGAALFLNNHSSILFNKNSVVIFNNNKSTNDTIYFKDNSNVTFNVSCKLWSSNVVEWYGAAIRSLHCCHATFTGISNVIFTNNIIPSANNKNLQIGGTIFSQTYTHTNIHKYIIQYT